MHGKESATVWRQAENRDPPPQAAVDVFVYLRVSARSLALINIAGVDVSKSGLFGMARNSSGAAALTLTAWEAITRASVLFQAVRH